MTEAIFLMPLWGITLMINYLRLKWDNVNKSIYTSSINISRNTLIFILLFLTSSFWVPFCIVVCFFVQAQPCEAKSLTYARVKEFCCSIISYSDFQSFWAQKQNLEFIITPTHPSDCSRNYIYIHLAFHIGFISGQITLFSYIIDKKQPASHFHTWF